MRLGALPVVLMAIFADASNDCWANRYPVQDDISLEMSVRVTADHDEGFSYKLSARSLPVSRQAVWCFGIDVPVTVTGTARAERLTTSLGRVTYWIRNKPGIGGTNWLTWYGGTFELDDHGLKPGEGVEGLEFLSPGLPGIRPMLAMGWVPKEQLPNPEDLGPERPDTPGHLTEGEDPVQNSFHGFAVGPEILPDSLSVTALADRLIVLKDSAARLGWIKDPGVVTSLNQKLANVRKALGRLFGGKKAARSILGAFLNEVEALRGKQMDDNAYYLLKVNAEYLIVRLGGSVPDPGAAKRE